MQDVSRSGAARPPTTIELVDRLAEQSSRLVREEVALAKAELKIEARHAGIGVGLFGGAGLFALLGISTLVAAAVAALSLTWAVWLSALVVAAVLFVVAGITAIVGRREVAGVGVPERTISSVKKDVEEIKEARS